MQTASKRYELPLAEEAVCFLAVRFGVFVN